MTPCYIKHAAWEVEFTDEFEGWWHTLSESEQGKVDARVTLLMERGPNLGFPFSSQVQTSRFPEMRELRAQAGGDPLRMLYAFDPRRTAILLIGGDKTGDNRWYETNVPIADRLFEIHLRAIEKERTHMAKKFEQLRAKMSPKAREASAVEHRRLVEEMSLLQLRKARELTQTKLAEELHMGQGDVSKLERRTDMYVSTLASYLQAVGADLEIRALFPDGRTVKITQFSE